MNAKKMNLVNLDTQTLRSINGGDGGLFFLGLFMGLIATLIHRASKQQ